MDRLLPILRVAAMNWDDLSMIFMIIMIIIAFWGIWR